MGNPGASEGNPLVMHKPTLGAYRSNGGAQDYINLQARKTTILKHMLALFPAEPRITRVRAAKPKMLAKSKVPWLVVP